MHKGSKSEHVEGVAAIIVWR